MKNSTFFKALAFLILAGATAAPAIAGGRDWQAHFDKMDANGDGQITKAEIADHRSEVFKAMDANNDGVLDKQEHLNFVVARMTPRIENRYQKMDSDNDGKVSAAEFEAKKQHRHFRRMDANNDGIINREEAEAAAEKHKMRKRH